MDTRTYYSQTKSDFRASPLLKVLRLLARVIPGDYLRTLVYLNLIEKPRRYLRLAFNTFYRIDHVYLVLQEFKRTYTCVPHIVVRVSVTVWLH